MKEKEILLDVEKGVFYNTYKISYKNVTFLVKENFMGKPEFDIEIPEYNCLANDNRFLTLNKAVKKAKEIIDNKEKEKRQADFVKNFSCGWSKFSPLYKE